MKFTPFLAGSVLMASGLFACGQAKNKMDMTINTGIPVQARSAVNLSRNLMNLFSVTIGNDCYQDQMYVITHDPATDQLLEIKKIKLRSIYNPAPPAVSYTNSNSDVTTAIDRIVNYSYLDEPITIQITKGTPVEVGVVGTFFYPADADGDGICDQFSGSNAASSSSMLGHTLVDSNAENSGSIGLNIDVLHTNPYGSAYSLAGFGQRYRDWVQFDPQFSYFASSTNHYGKLTSVSFLGKNSSDLKIKILVNNAASTSSRYYVPHFFPYVLEFDYNTSSNGGCTSGYPCSGHYQATVTQASTTISPTLMPFASPTPSNNPLPTFPNTVLFNTTTY